MADNTETRQLDHRAHMFETAILLILLETGIQAGRVESGNGRAIRTPGVVVFRHFVCICIKANFPGLKHSEQRKLALAALNQCHAVLMRTLSAAIGATEAEELVKLEGGDFPMLTVLLPSPTHQRRFDKYRLQ